MADGKRLISAEDVYNRTIVQDPQVSPDGAWIAFVVLTRDRHQNKARQAIWLIRSDGSGLRQFTGGETNDHSPRWRPDGQTLAFVSSRSGKPQIYTIPVDGGEARRVTYMLNGATDPAWSPDGGRIAYLSALRPDEMEAEDGAEDLPPASLADMEAHAPDAKAEDKRIDPRVVDKVPFRSGTTLWNGCYTHIYVVDGEVDGARPRRITRDARDYQAPQWARDGGVLFSTASRQPEHDMPDVFESVVRIEIESGTVTNLTDETQSCHGPKPSPDGRWLAYFTRGAGLPTSQFLQVAVMPVAGGEAKVLTAMLDRSVANYTWVDDNTLVFTTEDGGNIRMYQTDVLAAKPVVIAHPEAEIGGLHAALNGTVATAAATADGYYELYALQQGSVVRRLTAFNQAFLESVQVAEVEHISYVSTNAMRIDGWIIKPPDYDPGRKYPLALNVHGGPAGMWGAHSASMWLEWQHHAASGYVVFYCNPRGSSGGSEAFLYANAADWGEGPMADVMTGVDLLIERGLVDPDRLAITGGSYGGYLTAWIIGHDQRFAAAVAQRGVYHLQAFHGTTDIPFFMRSYMEAEPWESPELYWEQSPLAYAKDIHTPLLILHSENDFRVPISEGEQLFTTLKRLGRTVQMVRYPREGHELSRSGEPAHIVDRLERIVGWWDKYCKPK